MGWRESIQGASFKGVPFRVNAHQTPVGRRTARHEFAQRDLPYFEDMGRRAREMKFEAFVVAADCGGDYTGARDALIAVCESATPKKGTLVHPFLSSIKAVCTKCVVKETIREGGICVFDMEFVEAGEADAPNSGNDTAAAAVSAIGRGQAAAKADFMTSYDLPKPKARR